MESALTYFPKSKVYVKGEHNSYTGNEVIARVNTDSKTVLVNPQLKAAATKQLDAADTTIANSENVNELRYVKLFSEIAGEPMPYFWLAGGFVTRYADHLELDETFRSVSEEVEYPDGRLEESSQSKMAYAKIRYTAKKMRKIISVPIEDEIRSQFQMMSMELNNTRFAFSKKRNDLAQNVIKKIKWGPDGTGTGIQLKKIDTLTASDVNSTNDVVEEIQNAIQKFIVTNALPITKIILSPKVYTKFTKSTWVKPGTIYGLTPQRAPGGTITNFPGLEGIEAIVDPSFGDDAIYAISENALRVVESVKIQTSYPNQLMDTQDTKLLDFVSFESVDDLLLASGGRKKIGGRVFSFKMKIDGGEFP